MVVQGFLGAARPHDWWPLHKIMAAFSTPVVKSMLGAGSFVKRQVEGHLAPCSCPSVSPMLFQHLHRYVSALLCEAGQQWLLKDLAQTLGWHLCEAPLPCARSRTQGGLLPPREACPLCPPSQHTLPTCDEAALSTWTSTCGGRKLQTLLPCFLHDCC